MKILVNNGIAVVLLSVVASCSPVVYSTTVQNTPLFKEKGEASLTGVIASSDDGSGIGLSGAVAVTDHFALTTSYYNLSEKNYNDAWTGHGTHFELGGGLYTPFSKNSNWVFEFFGGIGFTGIKNHYGNDHVDVNYVKPYIQPSIGITHRVYEFSFTARMGVATYSDYTAVLADPDQQAAANKFFADRKSTFVFEPGVTARVGYKHVKGVLAFNYTSFSYDASSNVAANVNTTFVTVGVNYLFTKRYDVAAK